jgi:uroporphyrinogen III methyltransferase/synthase
MKRKKVYLVGAGPGDFGLISVRALELLREADVVVYDRLADKELLAFKKPDAELIDVGKASSRHTMRQDDINLLLVHKAKENKTVVRLKGGDPFVFGRGGEEAIVLKEHNIPFEIVPGITSAIAAPAYAGIPVTHRGVASSFAVITGHEDPLKETSAHKWDKLATATDTLVFLMGVENIAHISAKLIEHGRPKDAPAAVIRWGTKPEQRVLITTVANAAKDVMREAISPPAIFLVGEVVNLRSELAWFDNRELSSKTVLVTRSREQASHLVKMLNERGAKCIEAPVIKIVEPSDNFRALDEAAANLEKYDWLIFTSVNGVDAFFARLYKSGKDARAVYKSKIAAIGVPTADRLKTYGIIADVIPVEFRAEGIIDVLTPLLKPGMNVLIPRALEAREILPQTLRKMGLNVDVAPAYETVAGDEGGNELKHSLKTGEIDIVTFTSSSTVTNLLNILGSEAQSLLAGVKIACIGPVTAETCLKGGLKIDIMADEYTISGLVEAIEKYYENDEKGAK